MTVRLKTLATVSVTLVAIFAAMHFGGYRILIRSFREIETQDTLENIQRVTDALDNEIDSMAVIAADWGPWDDTYEFVLQPNAAYRAENFGDESLTNLGNDLMVYAQLSGRITWGTGFDPRGQHRDPLPEGFAPWVLPGGPLHHKAGSSQPVRGLIGLPDGPMIVVSHPILKNDRTGPARGALVLGRWFDSSRIERICQLTHLQINVRAFDDPALPAEFAEARAALSRGGPYLNALDEATMAGYALLTDIQGQPLLILQVRSPRESYQQGLRTARVLVISFAILGMVLLGVLFLVLERIVICPILRLSQDVGSVHASEDMSRRVDVRGKDEVAGLAVAVNDMLDSLEASHDKQHRSEALFRSMALNASDALFMAVPRADTITWYGDISGLLGLDAAERPDSVTGWLDYVHPDDREGILAAIRASRASGEAVRFVHRIRYADGGWRVWATRGKWLKADHSTEENCGSRFIGACKDITDRTVREEALRQSEERLARIVETNADGILLMDRERRIVLANAAAEVLFGATRDELIHLTVNPAAWGFGGPDGQPLGEDDCPFLRVIRSGHAVRDADYSVFHTSGRRILLSLNAAPLHDSAGVVTGVAVSISDITERKTLEERLTYQAFHDPLTNLPNRALFQDRLTRALTRSHRSGKCVSVLFLDLDNFKLINDSLGHGMGDHLLVQVARRLEQCLRESDTAARFGGDEFTVMAEDIDGLEAAESLAERIMERLHRPYLLGTREVTITPSIGIALSGMDDIRPDELLRNADAAMYEAKTRGKARIEVFHSRLNAHALNRLEMESDLRRALERGELEVQYQPKVAIAGGAVMSMEALVRWHHPVRGLIMPGQFIPMAEQSSLIIDIGRYVLNEACREALRWRECFPDKPPVSVSVNLSARQFQHPDLVADVSAALTDHGMDPLGLILEITESVLMDEADATIGTLKALKALGVRLAIDDFGTGYSSLSYLKRFPMDFVKIDRSFVSGLGNDSEDTVIVSATVSLAHALGLTVVAEGAETLAQVEYLHSIGCDLAQGFWFSKAMDSGDVPRYLETNQVGRVPALT